MVVFGLLVSAVEPTQTTETGEASLVDSEPFNLLAVAIRACEEVVMPDYFSRVVRVRIVTVFVTPCTDRRDGCVFSEKIVDVELGRLIRVSSIMVLANLVAGFRVKTKI